MRKRLFAFIIRDGAVGKELLMFDHLGYPEVGLQIPGGTIEDNESVENSIPRIVRMESGIDNVSILANLDPVHVPNWELEAYPYLLTPTSSYPDYWDFPTTHFHDKEAKERNEPMIFCYAWMGLPLLRKLEDHQMDWLEELLAKV
jgi:hypothetical protein